MTISADDRFARLLPQPLQITRGPGSFAPGRRVRADVDVPDERVRRAVDGWIAERSPDRGVLNTAIVRVGMAANGLMHGDAYQLIIAPDEINISGGSAAGCFYGIQTLRQLAGSGDTLPCCRIEDRPDFALRGLLHDVTRGKVPTLPTLLHMVDRLAALKINQLQLYIEHAFVFSFDPDICAPEEGLTPDDIRTLDRYCHERFIELVPSVANLGHMGRVLSMPRYRRLAEIEATTEWPDMSWPQRMRGFTLDADNPEAQRLVANMLGEVLDAFSAPTVNVCGDEPWDLGAGKNKARCEREGKAELYLGHLRRVQEVCAARDRRVQFWSDVLRNYPDRPGAFLPGATLLHWGYDDRADYAGTAGLVARRMPVVVCPGVSGWKRTLNAVNLAERNISTFARAGMRDGAVGLLNTDWGDHGHFNLLAGSWHGMALGACCAWRADHPTGTEFDQAFAWQEWKRTPGIATVALRTAAALSDSCETWRLLWMPCAMNAQEIGGMDPETLREASRQAEAARGVFTDMAADASTAEVGQDARELACAAEFTGLAAEKMLALRSRGSADDGATAVHLAEWTQRLGDAVRRYEPLWLARNKPAGLEDIRRALARATTEVAACAEAARS